MSFENRIWPNLQEGRFSPARLFFELERARRHQDVEAEIRVRLLLAVRLDTAGAEGLSQQHFLAATHLLPNAEPRIREALGALSNEVSRKLDFPMTPAPPDHFSTLEKKLLECLSRGACSKHELILRLYGKDASLEAAENRLKNLIYRTRARGVEILLEKGLYHRTSSRSEPGPRVRLDPYAS